MEERNQNYVQPADRQSADALALDAPPTGSRPAELADGINEILGPEERIVWCGRPDPQVMLRRTVIAVIVRIYFFLAFVAWFGLPVLLASVEHGNPVGVIDFQIVSLVAVVLASLDPLLTALRARRTAYVVTDRRFFALRAGLWLSVWEYSPRDIGEVGVSVGGEGAGDVWLVRSSSAGRRLQRCALLKALPEPQRVARALADLAAQSPDRPRAVWPWGDMLSMTVTFLIGIIFMVGALQLAHSPHDISTWLSALLSASWMILGFYRLIGLMKVRMFKINRNPA